MGWVTTKCGSDPRPRWPFVVALSRGERGGGHGESPRDDLCSCAIHDALEVASAAARMEQPANVAGVVFEPALRVGLSGSSQHGSSNERDRSSTKVPEVRHGYVGKNS